MSRAAKEDCLTPRKKEYERVGKKAARGEFTLVEPFDYMILEKLPEEGTLFAGMFPLGETVANLITKFPKIPGQGTIPTSFVAGRIHSMKDQGLVVKKQAMPGTSGKAVWQRTERGTKTFENWKKNNKGKANDGVSDTDT